MSTRLLMPPAAISQAITSAMTSWETSPGVESIYGLLREGGAVSPFGVLAALAQSVVTAHTTSSDSTSTTINTSAAALVTEATALAAGHYAPLLNFSISTTPPGGSSSLSPGTPTPDVAAVIGRFGNTLSSVLTSIPTG